MADSLLKEVDNALRLHKVQQLWQRAGKQITIVIALCVITLIALLIYKQQQLQLAQDYSDKLLSAMDAPDAPEQEELTGSFAQLDALLRAPVNPDNYDKAIMPSGQNSSALLAQYACLQSHALAAGNEQTAPSCHLNDAFSPLAFEYDVLRLLSADKVDEAAALLKTRDLDVMPKRLSLLKNYVRSHASEPTPLGQDDAAPITP